MTLADGDNELSYSFILTGSQKPKDPVLNGKDSEVLGTQSQNKIKTISISILKSCC